MTAGHLNAEEQIQRTSDHRDLESGRSGTRSQKTSVVISDATFIITGSLSTVAWKPRTFAGCVSWKRKRRLKQMYADPSLENRALKDVIAKKL